MRAAVQGRLGADTEPTRTLVQYHHPRDEQVRGLAQPYEVHSWVQPPGRPEFQRVPSGFEWAALARDCHRDPARSAQ
jgi:hypothetical protein